MMNQFINYQDTIEEECISLGEYWRLCFKRLAEEPEHQDVILHEIKSLLFNMLYYHLLMYATVVELSGESKKIAGFHVLDLTDDWVWKLEDWLMSRMTEDHVLYCELGGRTDRASVLRLLSGYDYIDSERYGQYDCADVVIWKRNVYYTRDNEKSRDPYRRRFALCRNSCDTVFQDDLMTGNMFLLKHAGVVCVERPDAYVCIRLGAEDAVISEKEGGILEIIGRMMIKLPDHQAVKLMRVHENGSIDEIMRLLIADEMTFRFTCLPLYLMMDENFVPAVEANGLEAEASYIRNAAVRIIWKVLLLHCFAISPGHICEYGTDFFDEERLTTVKGEKLSCKQIRSGLQVADRLVQSGAMSVNEEDCKRLLAVLDDLEAKYGEDTDISGQLFHIYLDVWQDADLIRSSWLKAPLSRCVKRV